MKEKKIRAIIGLIFILVIIAFFICLFMLINKNARMVILLIPILAASGSTILAHRLYRKRVKQSYRKLLHQIRKGTSPSTPILNTNEYSLSKENNYQRNPSSSDRL